jgi:predicted peptidase
MKFPYLPFLLLMLMVIYACDKPDEVLPVSRHTEGTATVTKAQKRKQPANVVNSEFYQYAKFNDMPYRILVPRDYDSTRTYPLLVFLHGIGERGTENEQQLKWGAKLFQTDSIRENYPAFIIFPQCQSTSYWFDRWETESLRGLIDAAVENYGIDNSKIYIGGLSMGAYGTYAMVARNPGLFAAAIAISGDGNTNDAALMSKTKWRIFAGKKDNVVSSGKSERMAQALSRSGATVSFTLYPEADHTGSWVKAFAEPDFCSWLFSVSKD